MKILLRIFVAAVTFMGATALASCSSEDESASAQVAVDASGWVSEIAGTWSKSGQASGYLSNSRGNLTYTREFSTRFVFLPDGTGKFTDVRRTVFSDGTREDMSEEFEFRWKMACHEESEASLYPAYLTIEVTAVNRGDGYSVGDEKYVDVSDVRKNSLLFSSDNFSGVPEYSRR